MESLNNMSEGSINISDVLDVIERTDPTFAAERQQQQQPQQQQQQYLLQLQQPQQQQQQQQNRPDIEMIGMAQGGGRGILPQPSQSASTYQYHNKPPPYVEIIEQPASKSLRFRYECEGRSAGSIPGVNSTPENKTYPTIRISNYIGKAIVVVSCVTRDEPPKPHPHNLVGKDGCSQGVCTMSVDCTTEHMPIQLEKLGIQCVKRKDIEDALRVRRENRVDPYKTGFDHARQPTSIDLNAVRLCFQVFLDRGTGEFKYPLEPVTSQPIFDKKAMSDLVICKLSHCSSTVAGGMEMIILCEKVAKEDIQVRFFEERNEQLVWEGFGDFQPTQVHKQVAIFFRTPSYRTQHVDHPVQAWIQLRRPSDGATSESLPFQLLPLGLDDPDSLKRKRQKLNDSPNAYLLKRLQAEAEKQSSLLNPYPQYNINLVKTEPADRLSPMAPTPSPPMYQVGNATNMMGLQPGPSSQRTSPMDFPLCNMPPMQPQQPNILQPTPQSSISPMLLADSTVRNNQMENNYQLTTTDDISNVIGESLHVQNGHENPAQLPVFDDNFHSNFSDINLSDIVKEVNGGDMAPTSMDSYTLDSFSKIVYN